MKVSAKLRERSDRSAEMISKEFIPALVAEAIPARKQPIYYLPGPKNPGYGRELSKPGIREFINEKLLHRGDQE